MDGGAVRVEDGPAGALAWLEDSEAARRASGVHRELSPREPGVATIDLASNDYLGLARHPDVTAGAVDALKRWGAGATGSRLVSGSTTAHGALERDLADFVGAETGLVFSSGYTANLGAVTALSGRGSLVVSDAGSHASLIDACRLSRARVEVTPHADVDAVDRALAGRIEQRALVLTDSVFSADGDLAPLGALHAVCRRRGALLLVDEAHGLGVRGVGGRGLVEEAGLAGAPDVVVTATLSKALGGQGGAVLADARVRTHVIDTARSFIFDTGLAPASVGSARAALAVLRREPGRASAVLERAGELASISGAPSARSAVVSLVLGAPQAAVDAAAWCGGQGLRVGCFRPPSVPEGASRLRLTARADLGAEEMTVIRRVLGAVAGFAVRDGAAAPA